ncbi:unnamed protein product [Orchesella dallaii]|uniref:L-ascorbate oxidase n=1 Tax=Orchesella dallaii TaxID=48710 RepID=A0ABP1QBR3_9HEXA
MVFRERPPLDPEREALLHSRDPYYRIRQSYVSKLNWKSVSIGLVAGLLPFLLWLAIFPDTSNPTLPTDSSSSQPSLLQQSPLSTSPNGQPTAGDSVSTNNANTLRFNPPVLKSSFQDRLNQPSSSPNNQLSPGQSASKNNANSLRFNPPVLKSIKSSPNWKKISTKTYRKNKNSSLPIGPQAPTEFGTYPQPTFNLVGNKTIATYHLIVTKGVISPDGFPQPAYLINGQSPGPEIRVRQHSILVVHVTNKLDTPLTIHFHGIHQRKSFLSDGVPHVTQDPIPPGGSFTYKMNLWPQVGTFFYHAHTNLDIMWLFGPLIVEDKPEIYETYPAEYQYDEDKVFILNGVYHEDLPTLVDRITGPVHDYPQFIASVTVNGRSFGEWTNNVSGEIFSTPTASGYDITSVKKGLTYRFRFINAASDSILSCNISSHTFTVIEMDGIYTEPLVTDHLAISPGQRYSVIIKMNQEDDNYYIGCFHMEYNGPLNGLAVLNYLNATKPNEEMLKFYTSGLDALKMDRWLVDDLTPNFAFNQTDVYKVPLTVDKEYYLDVLEVAWGTRRVYLINNHHYEDPEVSYYKQLQNGVNITNVPQVFEIIEGESVQFVFQNTRKGNFCFSHPWHIHGHSFHVVGDGPNKYDPVVDGARIQQDVLSGKKFQLRDAVTVFANQTEGELVDGAYCGWAAVRFSAHNNGIWLAHCHVTPHMMMGKKFVIWEHNEEDPMLTKLMNAKYNYNIPGEPGGW